jgi:hypothetical protein
MSQKHLQHVVPTTEQELELVPAFTIPEDATIEQRHMLSRYRRGSTPLLDLAGSVLPLVGVIYHDDLRRDETGEVLIQEDPETGLPGPVSCTRTIFLAQTIDGEEKAFHTFSSIVHVWVTKELLPLFGKEGRMGDLLDLVEVSVATKKSKTGRKYLALDFA